MPDSGALPPGPRYQKGIAVTIADPEARAAYAALPLTFRAVNDAMLPADADDRARFLADLSAFLRTGMPGRFLVAEENLRDLYLVNIGGGYRISRKVYATHPLIPGWLLVIGGVGIVQPDVAHRCLTLQTPRPGTTLHRLFPGLPRTAMSAGYPTPRKTIQSNPNVDPVGGYSLRVAEAKYHHAEMIHAGNKGIDPARFPVITNLAWGTIGEGLAFYVYALPDTAIPASELLHAASREELVPALNRYLRTANKLMQALRHLHEAGYVFNQAHQGNVYVYQDAQGEDQICIADLDTLQSIRGFSPQIPSGQYLSPRAFAVLVNAQVASANAARMAWIYFTQGTIQKLRLTSLPGLDKIYASIICELLTGYLPIPEARQAEIFADLRRYFSQLDSQTVGTDGKPAGIQRLLDTELYETDVFGFIFTYALLDSTFCRTFGARLLTEGIRQAELVALVQKSGLPASNEPPEVLDRLMSQATSQLIEARSSQAMQEFLHGIAQRSSRPPRQRA